MDEQDRIERAISFIEANLDQGLSVTQVCAHVGCSPFHFHRRFTEMAGISLMQYMLRRRLSEAARILRRTNLRVIDVAFDFGFENPETFSRAFRRVTGMTPRAYRRQWRLVFRAGRFDMTCPTKPWRATVAYEMIHLLRLALERGASDFTVAPGTPPYGSVNGRLEFLGDTAITPEAAHLMMASVTSERDQEALRATRQADYGFWVEQPGEARFRVSAIHREGQPGPIMRFFVESAGGRTVSRA